MITLPPLPAASMRPRQRGSASRDIRPISSSGIGGADAECEHGERDQRRDSPRARRAARPRPASVRRTGSRLRPSSKPDRELPAEAAAGHLAGLRLHPVADRPGGRGELHLQARHQQCRADERSAAPRRRRGTRPDRGRARSRRWRRTGRSSRTITRAPRPAPQVRTGVRRLPRRSRSGSAAARRATGPTAVPPVKARPMPVIGR